MSITCSHHRHSINLYCVTGSIIHSNLEGGYVFKIAFRAGSVANSKAQNQATSDIIFTVGNTVNRNGVAGRAAHNVAVQIDT